jgi:hypothetical protein
MKTKKIFCHFLIFFAIFTLTMPLLVGCQSAPEKSTSQPATAVANPTVAPVSAAENKQVLPTIRIKAGATEDFKDSNGNTWLPEQGFTDGDTVDRPELTIVGTTDQRIYQSEHYSMTKFTQPLPDGEYIVKLHFCETYDGVAGPGERVFSFNVAGREFKDFDVWVKAGGAQRAYVETVPVKITDGKLEITFTPNIENPQINGIEILPAN